MPTLKKILFPHTFQHYRRLSQPFNPAKSKELIIIRWIGFGLLCLTIINGGFLMNAKDFFRFFTQWGLVMTTITELFLILSWYFQPTLTNGGDVIREGPFDEVAIILYELMWTSNLVISIVFWLVLMPVIMSVYNSSTQEEDYGEITFLMVSYNCLAHLVPCLFIVLDAIYNRARFHKPHLIFPLLFGIFFFVMDITFAYTKDMPAYPPVLTYKNYYSIGVCIVFLALFIGGFFLGLCIGEKKERKYLRSSPLPGTSLTEVLDN